jgi:acetyl-CoA carboxylase biotin carboxyl carrier protein
MDLDLVEKLIALVVRSPIAELEVERNGTRVRIAKQGAAGVTVEPEQITQALTAPVKATAPSRAPAGPLRHAIRAPLTGVFYRSAAEGEAPLVSLGDTVEDGQRLCILEAMKTFNLVEADRKGRIVEIAFENQAAVNAGDVLFLLEAVA